MRSCQSLAIGLEIFKNMIITHYILKRYTSIIWLLNIYCKYQCCYVYENHFSFILHILSFINYIIQVVYRFLSTMNMLKKHLILAEYLFYSLFHTKEYIIKRYFHYLFTDYIKFFECFKYNQNF